MERKIILALCAVVCALLPQKIKCQEDANVTLRFGTHFVDSSLKIIVQDTSYHISYHIDPDSIKIEGISTSEGMFSYLQFPGIDEYDNVYEPGLPALPIKSLNLQIPKTNTDSIVNYTLSNAEFKYVHLPSKYLPAQETSKSDDDGTFEFQHLYYDTCSSYGNFGDYIEISPIIKCLESQGVVVNLQPVQYNPSTSTAKILTSLDIEIKTASLTTLTNEEVASGLEFYDPAKFISYSGTQPTCNKRIAIITRSKFSDSLTRYIQYRMSKCYPVDLYTTESFCHDPQPTAEKVKAFIRGIMQNAATRPKYILIVGAPNEIPFSEGAVGNEDNPATDFGYLVEAAPKVDMKKKFESDVCIGRWPADSIVDINRITDKIIRYESNIYNTENITPLAISGTGTEKFSKSQAKYMAKTAEVLLEIYRRVHTIDGRRTNSYDLSNALTSDDGISNLWFIYYTGHGDYELLGSPMITFSRNALKTLFDIPPILFSMACNTNGYLSNRNFGRKWTMSVGGGCANYGSTTKTEEEPDDGLSRKLFQSYSKDATLGQNIIKGMMKYYNCCTNKTKRKQIKRYNLFGDPSLNLKGFGNNSFLPENNFENGEFSEDNQIKIAYVFVSSTLYIKNKTGEKINLSIYDALGRLVFTNYYNTSQTIDCSFLENGNYFINANSIDRPSITSIHIIVNK